MSSTERSLLAQSKQDLGPFILMDCTAMDAVSAHRLLGQDARAQIHRILSKRLDGLGSTEQVALQIRRARKFQSALKTKLRVSQLDKLVKDALAQYQACLSAWALGAGLADFRHPLLRITIDEAPPSADDLAVFLQEDEVGCQTGAYREPDGSVIMWHAEEDVEAVPGERFDKLRLFSFTAANGRSALGFIYPDLLPGPTFAWQVGDFVQAVDTLHIKPVDFVDALLPNTLAWLSLFLGVQVSRQDLARQLGPFGGGYSLTSAYKKDGQVSVEKVEYANDQVAASSLGDTAGSYLFQTNVIRDLSQPIGAQEQTSAASRAWNEKRMARTARLMTVIQKSADALPLIFRLLRSRLGDDSAYANRDVKAYLVCRLTATKTFIWAGNGPALAGDQPYFVECD